jgi:hypothetical protein
MTRTGRQLTVLFVAVLMLVGACGSRSKTNPETEALEARLVAVSDLPAGYKTLPVTESGEKSRCDYSSRLKTAMRIATAHVGFQNTTTRALLEEVLNRYEPGRAAELMAAARTLPTDCATYTQKQGAQTVTVHVEQFDFPSLLDESFAVKVSASVATTTVVFHQVFMRAGDTLAVVIHGGLSDVDGQLTAALAGAAAEKLAA